MAQKIANPVGFVLVIRWGSLLSKKFVSLPSIPSVDKTKGVKGARRASAALLYFLFFSSSAKESTAIKCITHEYTNTTISSSQTI